MAAFFSTVGRIFVQEGGTWTPWVSYLRKEADYLEGGSKVQLSRLPWALPASVVQSD